MNSVIYHRIISITDKGVVLEAKKNRVFVNFDECAKNFSSKNGAKFGKCVATRDITTLSFVFYTQPETKLIFKNSFIKNLVEGKSAVSNFFGLQQAIIKAGYTTYDLS